MNIDRQKERQVEYLRRRVDDLESLVKQLVQQMPMSMMTGMGTGGGAGGGGFYADPGSTVVEAGDEATLTVMEARAGGSDVEVGSKTVLNRYSDDTLEDLRLILIKCRDGSYLIVGQDCPDVP